MSVPNTAKGWSAWRCSRAEGDDVQPAVSAVIKQRKRLSTHYADHSPVQEFERKFDLSIETNTITAQTSRRGRTNIRMWSRRAGQFTLRSA